MAALRSWRRAGLVALALALPAAAQGPGGEDDLMLFALRGMTPDKAWDEKWLKVGFWGLNVGLMLMLVFSLIPSGLYQFVQSLEQGTWYARSAAVVQSPLMRTFTWLRMPGDVIFGLGALAVIFFTFKAVIGAWGWKTAEAEVPAKPSLVPAPALAAAEDRA